MSHILKALNQADADRRRGQTPNVLSPPLPAAEGSRRPVWWWIISAILAVNGAVVGYLLWPQLAAHGEPSKTGPTPTTSRPMVLDPSATRAPPSEELRAPRSSAAPLLADAAVTVTRTPSRRPQQPAAAGQANIESAATQTKEAQQVAVASPPAGAATTNTVPASTPGAAPTPRTGPREPVHATPRPPPPSAPSEPLANRAQPPSTAAPPDPGQATPRPPKPSAPSAPSATRAQPPSTAAPHAPPPDPPTIREDTAQTPAAQQMQKVPLVHELDYAVQSRLPPMQVNVISYSEDAERRFAIINMKKYHEGDTLEGSTVTLKQIHRDGAVLNHGTGLVRLPAGTP